MATPPIIAAALVDAETGESDIEALLAAGADIDARDGDGLTALARVAKLALARRVAHWFSEGDIDGVPVSYTVTDGVMVFRQRNRPKKMSQPAQLTFTEKWCPEVFAYLTAVVTCRYLLMLGASMTVADSEGTTVRQHLDALAHPWIVESIAEQPKILAWRARHARGEARRAERAEASKRRLAKLAAKAKAARAKKVAKPKPKSKAAKAKPKSKSKVAKPKSKSKSKSKVARRRVG